MNSYVTSCKYTYFIFISIILFFFFLLLNKDIKGFFVKYNYSFLLLWLIDENNYVFIIKSHQNINMDNSKGVLDFLSQLH